MKKSVVDAASFKDDSVRFLASGNYQQLLEWVHEPSARILVADLFTNENIVEDIPLMYIGMVSEILYERFSYTLASNNTAALMVVCPGLSAGDCLRIESYVLELAHLNGLEFEFLDWIEKNQPFKNTFSC